MPKVTIDGLEIEVPAGTTVVRAAKQLGVDIPVFCYHPGLSIPANCRMCLVEIEKSPKPLPACYTEVSEGMVVRTRTEKVAATQKSVLEFILLNHPVDCPICDQAGECVLQEHYATWSTKPSRLFHDKVAKPKGKILGPTVVLDAERCILCTRCVRFTEEITGTFELAVQDRGEHAELTNTPNKVLDNPYSLNVVDICPVGALTSREFRFRRRVWFLDQRDSVCTGCARGCAVRIDSHGNQVERVLPRYNPDVNKWWMCDDGRRVFDVLKTRALSAGKAPGANGAPREVHALDGVRALAAWLQQAKTSGGSTGVALSASLTNEDVYAWGRLAAASGAKVYVLDRTAAQGDKLLRLADRDANRMGTTAILDAVAPGWGGAADLAKDAAGLEVLTVVDHDIAVTDALAKALGEVAHLAVITDLSGPLADAAQVVIPATPLHNREGTIVNADGWVQRLASPLKAPVGTVAAHVAAAQLAQAVYGLELDFADRTRPAQLFDRIAATVPAFQHLDYIEVGDLGRGLTNGSELAPRRARTEGTPEWEPDPVAPTYPRPFALRRGA
jgi:NADH-quinone oxidoreductase subunit G